MSEYSKWLKRAIERSEFKDFFLGTNGYQYDDRYNPSPISYKDNLMALYDLVSEEGSVLTIRMFEEFLFSISNDVEGIYILTNYVYILVYHT